jgi:hypothetical protein
VAPNNTQCYISKKNCSSITENLKVGSATVYNWAYGHGPHLNRICVIVLYLCTINKIMVRKKIPHALVNFCTTIYSLAHLYCREVERYAYI